MKEKIIALYIRLSVEDRDLDELKTASVSIQNQKVHLRNFLMCHPETASGEIREFIDDGYTGTNMDRPAFQEMMKLAREEQISCIVEAGQRGANQLHCCKGLFKIRKKLSGGWKLSGTDISFVGNPLYIRR